MVSLMGGVGVVVVVFRVGIEIRLDDGGQEVDVPLARTMMSVSEL